MNNKRELKYSQAIEELNQIVEDLQKETVDVDELSLKVKRAVELIKLCKEKIHKTELEVKNIVKELEEELKEEGG
ncbi:MAG: exodeoxyribonuclease VII small subunit [Candidatus Omnitrophica bacterium 4484_70.1]|nr:MAG: exodeoxyribonuclease VII small subunit [Candidatus Omnitrophica bacterium 4484_70.1]